jgi:hypothetical protein
MVLRITKVKQEKTKKVNIEYQVLGKNGIWDDFSFSCSDEALPEFYQALKSMEPHVLVLCELPDNYLERIIVKGVSASYTTDGVMGAVIIAAMQLKKSNCPLNLITPYKPSESYGDQPLPEEALLTPGCVAALKTMFNECIKYIAGYRAQTDLFKSCQPTILATEIVGAEIDGIFAKMQVR